MGFGAVLGARQRLFDKYVDTTAGTNGTGTRASPYNTWASVPATANLKVAVKRGSSFREILTAKHDGWTIDAYGSGAPPTVYGSDALTSWTAHTGGSVDVITNGGFEGTWTTTDPLLHQAPNWMSARGDTSTVTEDTVIFDTGTKSMKWTINATAQETSAVQTVALTAGVTYILAVRARRASGAPNVRFSLQMVGTPFHYLKSDGTWNTSAGPPNTTILHLLPAATTSWSTLLSTTIVTITPTATGNYALKLQNSGGANGVLNIDNVTLTGGGTSTTLFYADVSASGFTDTNILTRPHHVLEFETAGTFDLANINWLTRVATLAEADVAGKWYWDIAASRIYLRATDSANPSTHAYEVQNRTQGLNIQGRPNTKIRNWRFAGCHYGIQIGALAGPDPSDKTLIGNCEFWGNRVGVFADSSGTVTQSGIAYRGNHCALNGEGSLSFYGLNHDGFIEYNTVEYSGCDPNAYQDANTTVDGGVTARMTTVSIANDSRAGIWLGASDLQTIVSGHTKLADDNKIRHNDVSFTGQRGTPAASPGTNIWCDGPGTRNEVAYNRSSHPKSRCINLEGAYFELNDVHHNDLWGTPDATMLTTAVLVSRSAHNNHIHHNTGHGLQIGIWAQSQQFGAGDPADYIDNDFDSNLISECVQDFRLLDGAANLDQGSGTGSGSGNTYDRNLIGANRASMIQTSNAGSGTNHATLAAAVAVVPAITNTVQAADPLLVDPDNGDMTLTASSPARGAGVGGTDIGAHQYVA